MKHAVLLCIAAALTLCGCTPADPPTDPVVPDAVSPDAVAPVDEHEKELLDLMKAGNAFIESLQKGEQPSNPRQDLPESDALAAFKRFLDLDTLYVSAVDSYENCCTITGLDEYNYDNHVLVYFWPKSDRQWYCPMAEYLPVADESVKRYIDILRRDDAEALATWVFEYGITEDDIAYARKVIQYYKKNCGMDFSSTEITSVREYDNKFKYTVLTASGTTLEAEFAYGDNLCVPVLPERSSI
ncbi:MAG TPA: hypothetical protein PKA19_06710 [Bacillota bacterium]|nr:hypothetical protein [Bacillota bacterium]